MLLSLDKISWHCSKNSWRSLKIQHQVSNDENRLNPAFLNICKIVKVKNQQISSKTAVLFYHCTCIKREKYFLSKSVSHADRPSFVVQSYWFGTILLVPVKKEWDGLHIYLKIWFIFLSSFYLTCAYQIHCMLQFWFN